nr:MAG TPA: hypothetical protein [Caudoviricetes sp.]
MVQAHLEAHKKGPYIEGLFSLYPLYIRLSARHTQRLIIKRLFYK